MDYRRVSLVIMNLLLNNSISIYLLITFYAVHHARSSVCLSLSLCLSVSLSLCLSLSLFKQFYIFIFSFIVDKQYYISFKCTTQ